MVVAMMSVLVMVLVICVASGVGTRMTALMMVMIVSMKARRGHVFLHVPMQPDRRRPGKLERNDEHDDQGDEATHGGHSTEMIVSTKGYFIPCRF